MQSNIRKAFEKDIVAMPNGLGLSNTAFENVSFVPSANQAYQYVRLIPLMPENPTLGDTYHREVGFYEIVLSFPSSQGVGDLASMADKVKNYYKRGKTLQEGGDTIIVDRTPSLSSVKLIDQRAEIVIRISYFCEQF